MAEFESEELRRIFQNLADKLANTKGDENIVDKLKTVEAAIQALDDRIESQQKKSKADTRKANEELVKDVMKELDKLTVLHDIRDTLEDMGENGAGPGQGKLNPIPEKEMKSFGSHLKDGILAFSKFTDTFTTKGLKLADDFSKLDGSLGGFVKAVGMEKTALGGISALIDENIDAFRGLVNTAEGTIGSVKDLRAAMSETSLGAKEFADAIASGTQGTRAMGAQPWAQLYAGIKEQSKSMGYYGYTTQGLIKATNEYAEILQSRGDLLDKLNKGEDLSIAMNELLKTNNKMAYIMGQTRDEAMEARRQANQDNNIQAILKSGQYTNDQKTAAEDALTMAAQTSGEMGKLMKDMFASRGSISGENQKYAANLPPELITQMQTLAVDLRNGAIANSDEMMKRWDGIVKAGRDSMNDPRIKSMLEQTGIRGAMGIGNESDTAVNEILMGLQKQRLTTENDPQLGTNIDDQFTLGGLKLEQMFKDIGARFQDVLTTFVFNPLTQFGDYINGSVDWISGLIGSVRDGIAYLSTFNSAVLAISGLLAGGALLNGAASLVAGIVAKAFIPGVFRFASMIVSPLVSLTKGIFNLTKFMGSGLIKGITGAIGTAVRAIPGIAGLASGATGLAGRAVAGAGYAGAAVAAGLAGGEIAKAVDDTVSDALYKNVGEESKDAWYEFRKGGEGFWDFMSQGLNGVIQSGPNAGKNYWSGKQEYKMKNGEWVELSEDEKSGKVKIDEDRRDKWGGYDTRDPEVIAAEDAAKVAKADPNVEMPTEVVSRDELDQRLANNDSSRSEVTEPSVMSEKDLQQMAVMSQLGITLTELQKQMLQTPRSEVKEPQAGITAQAQLDTQSLVSALDANGTQTATALASVVAALERIYQTLRSSSDFDKDNNAIIRDRLTELNRLQEDMIRLSRR